MLTFSSSGSNLRDNSRRNEKVFAQDPGVQALTRDKGHAWTWRKIMKTSPDNEHINLRAIEYHINSILGIIDRFVGTLWDVNSDVMKDRNGKVLAIGKSANSRVPVLVLVPALAPSSEGYRITMTLEEMFSKMHHQQPQSQPAAVPASARHLFLQRPPPAPGGLYSTLIQRLPSVEVLVPIPTSGYDLAQRQEDQSVYPAALTSWKSSSLPQYALAMNYLILFCKIFSMCSKCPFQW
jgi:hypothetical protein